MVESKYKAYMGDAVYVTFDGYAIVLTTEDGLSVTNQIVLEPAVFANLDRWRETLKAALKEEP